jgi:hypothetical protein
MMNAMNQPRPTSSNGQAPARTACDLGVVKPNRVLSWLWLAAALTAGVAGLLRAETNSTSATATNTTPTNGSARAITGESSRSSERAAEPAGRLSFASFRVVNERNIFNGNRSGQRITSTRSSSQQRSVRVEAFTLVGTLLSEKGPVAFFDGTDSDFRKALKAGSRIAGFRIQEILTTGVRLEEGTNSLSLRVGTGMRREDEGLWKFSSGGTTYASSSGSSAYRSRSSNGDRYGGPDRSSEGSSNGDNSSVSSAPAGNADEILKRLMEKREKE